MRLVVDDERPDDLVVQALAVRVPQTPKRIEQPEPAQDAGEPWNGRSRERAAPPERVAVDGHRSDLHPPLAECAALPDSRDGLVDEIERAVDQAGSGHREVEPDESRSRRCGVGTRILFGK